MPASLTKNESIISITNNIANQISADFYKLKSSFKALSLYEMFIEILKNRGYEFKLDFDIKVHEEIKRSIIFQLTESAKDQIFTIEQLSKEAFYLGNVCGVLVHANIPVPVEMDAFGKYEVVPQDIAAWQL